MSAADWDSSATTRETRSAERTTNVHNRTRRIHRQTRTGSTSSPNAYGLGTDLGSRGATFRPIRPRPSAFVDWRHEVHRLRSRRHFGICVQQPIDVLGLSAV